MALLVDSSRWNGITTLRAARLRLAAALWLADSATNYDFKTSNRGPDFKVLALIGSSLLRDPKIPH